jgi:hypothetical protein
MIWRFNNSLNFWSIISLLFLVSCGESSDNNKYIVCPRNVVEGTIPQLKGTWVEKKDSLHVLEFTETEMVDFYNNSEINRYSLTIFDGLPGQGGYEDPAGKVIQIEESKDNFHHFTILILDSNYMELIHRTSGQIKKFNRLIK